MLMRLATRARFCCNIWSHQLTAKSVLLVVIQNDEFSTLMIWQQGQPVTSLDVPERLTFHGDSNPVVYERVLELHLECEFLLHKYPFDTQYCEILVSN